MMAVSTRQISLSDFAAHCLDEIESIQGGETVIEILSQGKVVAVLNPAPQETHGGSLGDWIGSGAGTVSGMDCLNEPTFQDADESGPDDFWHPLSAQEQAGQQQTPVVHTPEELLGDGTEEEWAGFEEALEVWRSDQMIHPLIGSPVSFAA